MIKFKLLSCNSSQPRELKVTDCKYQDKKVNEIIFSSLTPDQNLLKDGVGNFFALKNLNQTDISFINNEILEIKGSTYSLAKIKTDLLFAPLFQLRISNDQLEIKSVPFCWNGEIIEKIQLIDLSPEEINNYWLIIQKSIQGREIMLLSEVEENYQTSFLENTNKVITLNSREFNQLKRSVERKAVLKISVKKLKKNNLYHYEIECPQIFHSLGEGWQYYQSIHINSHQTIEVHDLLDLSVADLSEVLRNDKEDGILRIDGNYSDIKLSHVGDKKEQIFYQQVQKLIKKYRENYENQTVRWKRILRQNFSLLQHFHQQSGEYQTQKLIDQHSLLTERLKIFSNETNLKESVAKIQRDEPSDSTQKLEEITENLDEFASQLAIYQNSLQSFLKENWPNLLKNDPKIQKLMLKHKAPENFLNKLIWEKKYYWFNEDNASIDYHQLEEYLVEKKKENSFPNHLGYSSAKIGPGDKYEEWNKYGIKRSEAKIAISLDYSPAQWQDLKYQSFRERKKSRILADLINEKLSHVWSPPLTDAEKGQIKGSNNHLSLIETIEKIKTARCLVQAKKHYKDIIDYELNQTPKVVIYADYQKQIDQQTTEESLIKFYQQTMKEILKARINKFSSLQLAQEQAKRNIAQFLAENKQQVQILNIQYHNYAKKVEHLTNISDVLQFEQELIMLLKETTFTLNNHNNWLPFLSQSEKEKIRKVQDLNELSNQIQSCRSKRKANQLVDLINQYLQIYHEWRDKNQQSYRLQAQKLEAAKQLMENSLFDDYLREETQRLRKIISTTLSSVKFLAEIRKKQKKFNDFVRLEVLEELQGIFHELSRVRELTIEEEKSENDVQENIRLIKDGSRAKSLSLLNEKQETIPSLKKLEIDENNNATRVNHNSVDSNFQKQLLAIAGFCFVIYLFTWWYRKKKEEDPFW